MSDTAITAYEEITETKIVEYLDSAGITNTLSPNEKKMFINIAREFRLNPFKREIHITAYGEGKYRKCSIITGYEVYIKRAERTRKLDGWSVRYEGEGKTLKAIVQIFRNDWNHPFVHEVYYSECCQYNGNGEPNAVWKKMPRFMTKKVAIGQAFRLCFPDDLGGMPYEEAEMPQEEPRNITPPTSDEPVKENEAEKPYGEAIIDYGKAIGEVVKTLNPDQLPYFTVEEINQERETYRKTKNIEVVKNQYEKLKKTLEKRQAEFQPVPFESTPAMYTEPENDSIDDIPDKEGSVMEPEIF